MNTTSNLYQELDEEQLRAILRESFGAERLLDAKLLSGGLFNTTYRLEHGNPPRRTVLRLGPVNRQLLLDFEQELMRAECEVYRLCGERGIPSSRVLACDLSRRLVDRDYMIVEYIDSVPMSDSMVDAAAKPALLEQVGRYAKRLHEITRAKFGRAAPPPEGKGFTRWSDFLETEIGDATCRLERAGGLDEAEGQLVRDTFAKSRALLDEITIPRLVHTDLWEGNFLLRRAGDGWELAAVIDADRALFGDVDFEFASDWGGDEPLLRGCGMEQKEFADSRRVLRRKLYRIVYHSLDAYIGFAEYNNQQGYEYNKERMLSLSREVRGETGI